MVERKDISDMSFEEFFKKTDEEDSGKNDKAKAPAVATAASDEDSGFGNSTPKINFKDGRFVLYVPRYRGKGPFNAAVCSILASCPFHAWILSAFAIIV